MHNLGYWDEKEKSLQNPRKRINKTASYNKISYQLTEKISLFFFLFPIVFYHVFYFILFLVDS
jgi:hypothetical protein